MDKIIDAQFSRVEKALSILITSIATYNPNPHLATDLVAADQELTDGLELCTCYLLYHPAIQTMYFAQLFVQSSAIEC